MSFWQELFQGKISINQIRLRAGFSLVGARVTLQARFVSGSYVQTTARSCEALFVQPASLDGPILEIFSCCDRLIHILSPTSLSGLVTGTAPELS